MVNNHNFKVYTFPNGFRLAWQQTHSNNVFGNLKINHGALHEVKGQEGIAHFLEHMLIEGGTSKHAPEEQARIRGKFGYTNAMTSRTRTMIPWGMVSSDLETYLDMASQMAFFPCLDGKVLRQQKNVVLSEISMVKGSPDFDDIWRFFIPVMARDRDHTYFILGDENVIRNITEAQLRDFHAAGYSPNNMILMLAGKLPLNLVEMVGNYFGSVVQGPGKPIELSRVNPLETKSIRYSLAPDLLNKDTPEESNSHLRLGVVVPDEFHKDSAALTVVSEILGSSWTAGLKKRIRSEGGMSYNISSFYNGSDNYGYLDVHGKVKERKQEEAIKIIFEELDRLRTSKQNTDEVESAKRRVAYETANLLGRGFNNMTGIDPANIAEIGRMDYFFDGRVPIKRKLREIESVTPEDVQRVSGLYLPSDRETGKYILLVRDPLKG